MDAPAPQTEGNHFSCSLSATLLARIRSVAGDGAVAQVLLDASSPRTLGYLQDIGNWISYDEAMALFDAGTEITGDPNFARHVGEDTVKQLGSSSTAAALRALGSPEALLKHMTGASQHFSTVATLTAVEVRPGYAEISAAAKEGFVRHPYHCEWTSGLLTQSSALFGIAPATVEHDPNQCQARGAQKCLYKLHWQTGVENEIDAGEQIATLKAQLAALSGCLENMFITASDLISSSDLNDTLARITDRAAQQVRAPKYLLAVRYSPDSKVHYHQKGWIDEEAAQMANRVLDMDSDAKPDHWLVASVNSHHRDYGVIVAMGEPGTRFFPLEHQLLKVYARYAAAALDSTTALHEAHLGQQEAQRRYEETRSLLELARQLATAASSEQIASRLANAIPDVVNCDRASVYLWDEVNDALVREAVYTNDPDGEPLIRKRVQAADVAQVAQWIERPDLEPCFIDESNPEMFSAFHKDRTVASVVVPISTVKRFLGLVVVSVFSNPERLSPSQELRDHLLGFTAHAVTALQNGRLIDHVTYQANHDQLTDLVNRKGFNEQLNRAAKRARNAERSLALFYIDLNNFKSVNDEWGDEVGDRVLRAVAERLSVCVRPTDTVARLGGDEFAVLVEVKEDVEGTLCTVSARLESAMAEPFSTSDGPLSVSASLGCVVWPDEVDDYHALLRQADAAMYKTKTKLGGSLQKADDGIRTHDLLHGKQTL